MKPLRFVLGIACASAISSAAFAQNYPTKPVRLIAPFAPGGPTDIVARVVAQRLGQLLGQTVVVDNRASAGGAIGCEIAARSAPDGYTLLLGSSGNLAVAPSLQLRSPYDPVKDFQPITQTTSGPQIMVPAMVESGLPGFETTSWHGMLAPARTPKTIAGRLHTELVKMLTHPEVKTLFANQGMDVVANTPDEFAAYIRHEAQKWAVVIKTIGLKAQ